MSRRDFISKNQKPVSRPEIKTDNSSISSLIWLWNNQNGEMVQSGLIKNIHQALVDKFIKRNNFTRLPLGLKGSPFQLEFWCAMMYSTRGVDDYYSDLAKRIIFSSRVVERNLATIDTLSP